MNAPELIITRPAEGVLQLTLNRPQALNAVTISLADLLADALKSAAHDDSVRCIVMTGAGERAFSSGYDIREMAAMSADSMLVATAHRCPVIRNLARHPKPVIAALNGMAHGVGALYAMAADIRIACPQANFRVAAALHGAAEGAWQLPHIVGAARAKEILLTARVVDANEALSIGLLHQVVPQDRLQQISVDKAAQIAAMPPLGTQWVKKLIDDGIGHSLDDQFHTEQLALLTTLRPPSGEQTFEGFLSRRAK